MALKELFPASVRRNHYTVRRVFLGCIDWRFLELIKLFREAEKENLEDPFDFFHIPGGVKKLARPRSEEALFDILRDIKITFGHKPEEYVLILHRGCAAYGDEFPEDPEAELKRGKKILEDFLAKESYRAEVRMIFEDWDKVYEVV